MATVTAPLSCGMRRLFLSQTWGKMSNEIQPARPGVAATVLYMSLLCVAGLAMALADDTARTAKLAELMKLNGSAQLFAASKLEEQTAARNKVQLLARQVLAQHPHLTPEKRARIDSEGQRLLRAVDAGFDQDAAVRAWGQFYGDSLTDADLDAILAYRRSVVGQKDAVASQGALLQFQHYVVDRQTAVINAAVANYTAAVREIVEPSAAASVSQLAPAGEGRGAWDTKPTAPDGSVVSNPVASEQCDITPSTVPAAAHAVPPSGRSTVCVCTDEKGVLTRDPVIAESSGDSRVDSGAVRMARSDSGRYRPPTVDGRPQKACFRYVIDFGHKN
jgi:hypothetical protein